MLFPSFCGFLKMTFLALKSELEVPVLQGWLNLDESLTFRYYTKRKVC